MKKRTKKCLFIITVTLLTLLVGGEIYLRLAWGFCDSVLMQSDPDFKALTSRFRQAGIPFFIWLHPERSEFEKGSYNSEGKEIIDFCKQDSVLLIEGLEYMSADDYLDGIHVNERGQQVIAETLKNILMECM